MTPPRYNAESGTGLEEPPVDVEEPKTPETPEPEPPEPEFPPETPEDGAEVEVEVAATAKNVAEFLKQRAEEYKTVEDPAQKRRLAWEIMKIETGFRQAGLKPEETLIASAGPGILGFYAPNEKQIYFTPYGLQDLAHIAEVGTHERIHSEGIADEGLTQLITRKEVANARRTIYLSEQIAVEQRFDVPELIERYDIGDPEVFADYYVEEEWRQQWQERLGAKAEKRPLSTTEKTQRELFRALGWQVVERVEHDIETALPRLHEKLESKNYKFDDEQFEKFQVLYEEFLEKQKAT